jgi:hypothetical protein
MVERAERAAKDAHVSMRPAPDCMTRLSALLPVKDGVAIDVALTRHAQAAKASGDPRSLGQLKAALLVAWVRDGATRAEHDHTVWASDHTTWTDTDGTVGPGPTADSAATSSDGAGAHGSPLAPALGRYRPADGICQHGPRVEVQVTITDLALLGFTTTPAYVAGYGTVPAGVARQIIRDATEQERSALRRLWTNPGDGTLTQMEAKSRLFPKGLARFIRARDQVCTTEYCGAPIRQIDHIHAYAAGGPTTANNGQGLCTACNQAKEHTDIRPDHLQDYPTKPWNRCSSTA